MQLSFLTSFRLSAKSKKLVIFAALTLFILLNLRIFLSAYHIMIDGAVPGNNFALDFGSSYMAAWRLLHDPSQLYAHGIVPGEYSLGTSPTQFKYLPYFSLFIIPFLVFDYIPALVSWNIFQFLLLPIIGIMLYRCLKDMNVIVILATMWIVLLQPLPYPGHPFHLQQLYFSQSYYFQWTEGQSKVFLTFLIVASYYFAKNHKPYLAGLLYGLAFYDPRFGLYSIPLFLLINRNQYRKFSVASLATLLVGSSILFYDGLAAAFVNMVEISGIRTHFFQYTWIPFYAIGVLTIIEAAFFLHAFRLKRNSVKLQSSPNLNQRQHT